MIRYRVPISFVMTATDQLTVDYYGQTQIFVKTLGQILGSNLWTFKNPFSLKINLILLLFNSFLSLNPTYASSSRTSVAGPLPDRRGRRGLAAAGNQS